MAAKETNNKNGGLVPVFIPKTDKNDTEQYVAINGRRFLIKKGQTVMVPPEVKEVLDNAQEQERVAQAFIEDNAE